jgi:hypothetical protein
MKMQDDNWRTEPPALLTTYAVYAFRSLAKEAAGKGRAQDILEDFKWRFSDGKCSRSSTESDAEHDLTNLMHRKASNAALFVEAFCDACADLRQQGSPTPSISQINRTLTMYHVGLQIDHDVLVHRFWTPPGEAEGLAVDVSPDDEEVSEDIDIAAIDQDLGLSAASPVPVKPPVVWYGGGGVPVTIPVAGKATQPLKVFLCHSSGDKSAVKKLYRFLRDRGYDPWLDAVNLLPGEDWEAEIKRAVKASHVCVVCLSKTSVTKAGFAQKEIKFALDVADEQPEGTIYIIPARLDDCTVPDRLSRWHWVNLFEDEGHGKLLASLARRASDLSA